MLLAPVVLTYAAWWGYGLVEQLRPDPSAPPPSHDGVTLTHPQRMDAGTTYLGTVTVRMPDGEPVPPGAPGAHVNVVVSGRGVPDHVPDGAEPTELSGVIFCSGAAVDVTSGGTVEIPCDVPAPPSPGPFDVTVAVTSDADGVVTTRETVVSFTVVD